MSLAVDEESHLAFRFARQLRDPAFRAYLARRGYVSGEAVTVVSERTVLDLAVLSTQGRYVVQEAPDSEFGWVVLPPE